MWRTADSSTQYRDSVDRTSNYARYRKTYYSYLDLISRLDISRNRETVDPLQGTIE